MVFPFIHTTFFLILSVHGDQSSVKIAPFVLAATVDRVVENVIGQLTLLG